MRTHMNMREKCMYCYTTVRDHKCTYAYVCGRVCVSVRASELALVYFYLYVCTYTHTREYVAHINVTINERQHWQIIYVSLNLGPIYKNVLYCAVGTYRERCIQNKTFFAIAFC